MKAARYHGRGDVRIENVPEPEHPARDEVIVDVSAASICGTDSAEWAHGPQFVPLTTRHPSSGHLGPVTLGHEFVGRVAEVGSNVEGLSRGDRVACGAGVACGACQWCRDGRTNLCARYFTLGLHADGGLAERVRTPAAICRLVPEGLDDRGAALAQPFAVALHAVRRADVRPGETLAVLGAGGIGAFVIAAAAARSPGTLIAVDIAADRLETARRLGATQTVDAGGEDVVGAILAATGGEGAHVVIEASGAPTSPAIALASARRGGRVALVGLQAKPRELDLFSFTIREVDIVTTLAHVCAVDLPEAVDLLADGDLPDVLIDRVIPLEALVEGALRPLAEGTAHGKIVVDLYGLHGLFEKAQASQ